MTVVSSGSTITFAGDGVQTLFDFNFRIFKAEDLCAVVRSSEGAETKLIQGTDFKIVSGVGADSGKIQYPVSGDPLPSGDSITLYREIPYTQELELVENDAFSVQLLNEAFDRGVMRDQQLQEQVDRALKYDISTPGEDRLSPQEMVRTITTAKDEAVAARSGAIKAEDNARGMLGDAQAAQTGAEAARDAAQAARSAAEEARDSAIKIAVGDITALRSPVPVLSGPAEAAEGTTVSITISDHTEDGVTSYEVTTLGFGTASISGNNLSWTLETTGVDISKSIEVGRRRRGELYSDTAIYQLLVKHVPIQDGPTMAFADTVAGYPGATVEADGAHAPAHSVGAENAKQIVAAKPEVTALGVAEIPAGFGLRIGAGAAGEYLGPEIGLDFAITSFTAGANILPVMTGYVQDGWTASASKEVTDRWAWEASNGNPSMGSPNWLAKGTSGWVRFSHESKQAISGYSISTENIAPSNADRMVTEFKLQGSNDGAGWVDLDSQSGVVWATSGAQEKTYMLSEMANYKEYQLLALNNGGGTYVTVPLLKLFGVTDVVYPSTASDLVFTSSDSIKGKVFILDGEHNDIEIDGVKHKVVSVIESESGGTYTTTVTLETPLNRAPAGREVVKIPDRCILAPASYSAVIDGDGLKITGAEITLEDNPNLKRLAMAVSGDGVTFKSGKIYIKEKP
ncbi:hypothetical protein [Desulfovibrio sp. JC010]|uniref:hypothetical protein n=1 Tax=Desulfovibrio sp. JC010 TaxID=2593641 RepID=UPI0013D791A1|nr:hypothetical protein [Desulfovibrio sp. JC010]NDV28201.1 hypothetical protein [Desulfovibrio sp. JC010]